MFKTCEVLPLSKNLKKIFKTLKPVKAIKEFFIDRSATNQNKNGAYRYRDYMTKMDFQWLISQIRQWDHESDWER